MREAARGQRESWACAATPDRAAGDKQYPTVPYSTIQHRRNVACSAGDYGDYGGTAFLFDIAPTLFLSVQRDEPQQIAHFHVAFHVRRLQARLAAAPVSWHSDSLR